MKAVVVADISNMPREDWLELRRQGIGGSDIGAICGVNPHRSAYEVWVDKIGMEFDHENEAMEWGNRLEELVVQKFTEAHPEWCAIKPQAMYRHPEHEWVLANCDRILRQANGEEAILEIKTSRYGAGYFENSVPDHVMLQVQWYLGVCGLRKGYVAVLIGGQEYHDYEIAFDPRLFDTMLERAESFWARVLNGDPPQPDGGENTSDLLTRMFPQTSDELAELPPQALELAAKYDEAKKSVKHFEYMRDEAANQLKAMLKEHSSGVVGDYRVTWKEQTRRSVSSSTLKREHPDIWDELATESTARIFTVKKAGEQE